MTLLRKRLGSLPHAVANLALPAPKGRPVFVTGNGRSGTSWIGEALGRADGMLYYREPCHPKRNGLPPGPADAVWCRHLRPGDRDPFFEWTLGQAFRGQFWRGSGYSLADYGHRLGQRPRVLVKEVAAFLSVEWVAARWNPQVVVILRHPGAYAASVMALKQDPEELARLRILLATPSLREEIGPLAALLDRITDPVEAAVASWAIRTKVALGALNRHPDWTVVQYEDVARDPEAQFRALYARLDLPWTEGVAGWIRARTQSESAGQFSTARVSHTRIDAWRDRLAPDSIAALRRLIEPFGLPLYGSAADWEGSTGEECAIRRR